MIFGHIVGLTQTQKNTIYQRYSTSKYMFRDLDDLTDLIMDDKNMLQLIQRYEYYLNKSKSFNVSKLDSKKFLSKSRELNNKINAYWKSRMEFYINEILNEDLENKMLVLLGYSNFYRNMRTFIKLETTVKLFIDIKDEDYTKEIIGNNIDQYKDDIIEGNFNLDLINPTFLIKRRQTVTNLYSKRGYDLKNFDDSVAFMGNSLENYDIPPVLYYASKYKYKTHIPIKDLIAYNDEWISIVSSFKNNKIAKGYMDEDYNKPYVQELAKNNLKKLKTKIYVYAISNTQLFVPVFTKNYLYKYKTTQHAQIYKTYDYANALERLKNLNIELITLG